MLKRTIIITGGSSGIGAEIARAFHSNGDHVVLASRTDHGLAEQLGENALYVKTDVCSVESLKNLMHETLDWTGRIDVLINNVGKSAWKPLAEINEEFWQEMLDVNLKSVLFASQLALPSMREGASIINISSLAGKRGSANNSVYCASKFGVNGITQSLAKELGSQGIRVNAICPVYINTPGLEEALQDSISPTKGQSISSYLKAFIDTQTALGRLPQAEEVAATCLFLASTAASAITGQCINVDCGVMPQ